MGHKEGQGCLEVTQHPCEGLSQLPFSKAQPVGCPGRPSPLPSLPGLRVSTYNSFKGCFNASLDEMLPTFQGQMPPAMIGINGSGKLEGGPERDRVAPRKPSVCARGLRALTFHSPSSGCVSCTWELPWELRVWEGSM